MSSNESPCLKPLLNASKVDSSRKQWTFELSTDDRKLLKETLYIASSEGITDLILKRDPNAKIIEVKQGFSLDESDRSKWFRCCECNSRTPHKKGFLVEFSDDTRGTIGRHCGRMKHDLDHKNAIQEFEEKKNRALWLQKLLIFVSFGGEFCEVISQFRNGPKIEKLKKTCLQIQRDFGDVWKLLETAPDGNFYEQVKLRDNSAEIERSDKLDNLISRRAKQNGLSRATPGVDKKIKEYLASEGNPLADNSPIYRIENRVICRYTGSEILSATTFPGKLEKLENQLCILLNMISKKSSENFQNTELKRLYSQIESYLKKMNQIIKEINCATAFFGEENIFHITKYFNKKSNKRSHIIYNDDFWSRPTAVSNPIVNLTIAKDDSLFLFISNLRHNIDSSSTNFDIIFNKYYNKNY